MTPGCAFFLLVLLARLLDRIAVLVEQRPVLELLLILGCLVVWFIGRVSKDN